MMTPLEEQLRAAKPRDPPPPELHAAIMAAVRTARPGPPAGRSVALGRALMASAAALALALGALWLDRSLAGRAPTRSAPPITAVVATLEEGRQLTERAPAAALAPLAEEMEALQRDFRAAVEFLIASVP